MEPSSGKFTNDQRSSYERMCNLPVKMFTRKGQIFLTASLHLCRVNFCSDYELINLVDLLVEKELTKFYKFCKEKEAKKTCEIKEQVPQPLRK